MNMTTLSNYINFSKNHVRQHSQQVQTCSRLSNTEFQSSKKLPKNITPPMAPDKEVPSVQTNYDMPSLNNNDTG